MYALSTALYWLIFGSVGLTVTVAGIGIMEHINNKPQRRKQYEKFR
jgi:hypothetical protein